jgi:putative glycosyltransferase (TIGR04372 family)
MLERVIGLPIILMVIACSNFIEIRVGRINNKVIGHFAMELDAANLLNRELNSEKKIVNLWYFADDSSVNKYLAKLVREKFNMLPRILLVYAYGFFTSRSKFNHHIIQSYDFNLGTVIPSSKKLDHLFWMRLSAQPALLRNSSKAIKESNELLLKLGSTKSQFACLHIRDSKFKTSDLRRRGYSDSHIKGVKASTHHRNSNIENFILGCKVISDYGIAPIRVGREMKELSLESSNVILDYTYSSEVNDKNDILLAANCKFMICTLSGFSEVSKLFRVPIFYLDLGEFFYFASKVTSCVNTTPIILPKIIKYRSNGKMLNFQEIHNLGIYELSVAACQEYLSDNNCPIVVEENSPIVIAKTIELGINFLDKKSEKLNEVFEIGQVLFSQLYNLENSQNLPAISPYWPNANVSKESTF